MVGNRAVTVAVQFPSAQLAVGRPIFPWLKELAESLGEVCIEGHGPGGDRGPGSERRAPSHRARTPGDRSGSTGRPDPAAPIDRRKGHTRGHPPARYSAERVGGRRRGPPSGNLDPQTKRNSRLVGE